jgi:hypothetical protein
MAFGRSGNAWLLCNALCLPSSNNTFFVFDSGTSASVICSDPVGLTAGESGLDTGWGRSASVRAVGPFQLSNG